MLLTARLSQYVMIKVERLHYGKLVSDNGGVASSGLGVTLRSKNLSPGWEADLRLDSLLDVKVFDPDMIDPMSPDGLLLVRTFPKTKGPFAGSTILVRARFRPERGEGAGGRVHPQAAIWVVKPEDWAEHAASILAKAGSELRAVPDRAEAPSSERFEVPPLEVELLKTDPRQAAQRTDAVRRILDKLLPSQSSDATLDFGKESFKTEAEFLAEVGTALGELARYPRYPHWQDVCIGSGLRQGRSGLLIRHLPSEKFDLPITPIEDVSIDRRLNKLKPNAAKNEQWMETLRTSDRLPSPPIAPPSRPNPPLPASITQIPSSIASSPSRSPQKDGDSGQSDFGEFLDVYRQTLSAEAARQLIASADWNGNQSTPRSFDERNARNAIGIALRVPVTSHEMAEAFDCLMLVDICGDADNSTRLWLEKLRRELRDAQVLLPAEVARLKQAPFFAQLRRVGLEDVIEYSERLKKWFDDVTGDSGVVRSLQVPERRALQQLIDRLAKLPKHRPGELLNVGIHDTVAIGTSTLLSADEFLNLAHGFLLPALRAVLPTR